MRGIIDVGNGMTFVVCPECSALHEHGDVYHLRHADDVQAEINQRGAEAARAQIAKVKRERRLR